MSRIGKWLRSRIVFVGLFVAMLSGLGIAANNFDSVWHERVLKNRFYFDGRRGNEKPLKDISNITIGANGTTTLHGNVISQNLINLRANAERSAYYRFDGTGDYIEFADTETMNFGTDSDFSIAMVIRPQNITDEAKYLISKDDEADGTGIGWGLRMDRDDLYVRLDDSVTDSSGTIAQDVFTAGEINHVAVTFDKAGSATAYINGILRGNISISDGTLTHENATVTRIATESDGTTNSYTGQVYSVQIFNKALTQSEVTELMSGSVPYKYQVADNGTQSSGVLTIGKAYRLTDWIEGDDFTNVLGTGAATQTDDMEFVATATTPTIWTNSSTVHNIGIVNEYVSSGMTIDYWVDSQNSENGTVTNATLHNADTGRAKINHAINQTILDVGSGTVIFTGSNTAATAIVDLANAVVGKTYTIITEGNANHSTIADSGRFNLQQAWNPDSADDLIMLYVKDLEAGGIIEIGTATN